MPYIRRSSRDITEPMTPGGLNFMITKLCHEYIQRHGLEYTTLNEVIGVLECAKQELYRMVAAPYENMKQTENGAISELDGGKHE